MMEYKGYGGPKQSGFIFGGDTGFSYGQLQTKRRIADMLASNVGRTPRNVGEGLNAVGRALMFRRMMQDVSAGEAQGQEKAKGLIAAALQGRKPEPYASSGSPMTVLGIPPRSEDQAIGDEAMAALGKDGAMSNEGRILKGLTERGLPEHVAQGFVMNFHDESGLNPGINEHSPFVPGSRGGFGLAQWTGPRRRQLEAFAADRGVPVDDMDLQLDFLVQELQGSEANAGRTILSTRNRSEAAQAIVNDFLRPAEEHRARRAAQYGGTPSEPPQQDYSAFYAALSSPWVDQSQKAMLMAELEDRKAADNRAYDRWSQQNDPMRQLQLERAQLELDNLRNPQPGFSVLTDEQEIQMGLDPAGSYQRGADGKISQIGGGGTNVSVTTGGSVDVPEYPKAPTGFMYVRDPVTGQVQLNEHGIATMAPILGGPAANEAQALEEKEANKNRQAKLKLGTTLTSIGLNLAEIKNGGLPVTGAVGDARRTWLGQLLTGSDAVDFGNRTNQITDSAAFAEIQNMRDNSPTGGAVGQLTDKERTAIGNAVTALNNSTSAEEYARAAKAYQQLALNIAYGEGSWELLEDGTVQATAGGMNAPSVGDTSGYATMSLSELINLDVDALTPAQQDAVSRRLEELGY